MKLKSRFYSLIEILIAVTLLVSLLGLAGINIRSAWSEQAFQKQADRLLATLNLAQDMLVVLKVESDIDFRSDGAHWVPVGNINRAYEALIDRETLGLSHFSEISFDDVLEGKKEGEFKLKFHDIGFVLPQGTLKLVSRSKKELYISLPGYPSPLRLTSEPPDERLLEQKERGFYEQITHHTFNEPAVQNL